MFKYKLIDRRIDLKVLGGLSTNLLLGSRVYYSEGGNTEQIGTLDDLRTFNYSGNLGLGINTGISNELEFIFEPLLKYYLNSINGSDNYVESRPWSFGLYTGFRYNF
jgi:hypothetical protein